MKIIKTKKDIRAYIKESPIVAETRVAYDEDEENESDEFEEVEEELVSLIAGSKTAPEFGEDWESWLEDNIDELLQEAISIVM